jgi:hypothetical protein
LLIAKKPPRDGTADDASSTAGHSSVHSGLPSFRRYEGISQHHPDHELVDPADDSQYARSEPCAAQTMARISVASPIEQDSNRSSNTDLKIKGDQIYCSRTDMVKVCQLCVLQQYSYL